MDNLLVDPFRRLLDDLCTPATVREEEKRPGVATLWRDLEASGFLDALVPEEKGGAGLSVSDAFPLVVVCGEYAMPAPFAETMVARALLGARGVETPPGAAIILAPPSPLTPLARKASHALVPRGARLVLIALEHGETDPFNVGGCAEAQRGNPVVDVAADGIDLLAWAAALTAADMAGGMARILEMAIRYACEREQFGRPLGKFQAIQQQLAVAAEESVSAHTAARIGMSGKHIDPLRSAVAKARAGEASHILCAVAHAVHGAIGVAEEYDLQLYTRRLKQSQMAFGSEAYWARKLGEARLATTPGTSADFVRLCLQADG